jgi:hypothetical protein
MPNRGPRVDPGRPTTTFGPSSGTFFGHGGGEQSTPIVTSPYPSAAKVRFGLPSRDPHAPPPFGRSGLLIGLTLVAVIVGGLVWAAASGQPAQAQKPRLLTGSLVLEDTRPLTVINVATAQITVRLAGVNAQIGAANEGQVEAFPVAGGTMLVNSVSGSFNYLEADNYVTDPNGPGVGLGPLTGSSGAQGYPAGADAYIVRTAPNSTVSLVSQKTVAEAAKAALAPGNGKGVTAAPAAAVSPLGYSAVPGPVGSQPGAVAVFDSDLWGLVGQGSGCRLEQLHPVPTSRQGLVVTTRGSSTTPCGRLALEAGNARVAVASPGQVEILAPEVPSDARPGTAPVKVSTPFTTRSSRIMPVSGTTDELWFLAQGQSGWQLFGVNPLGRTTGPFALSSLGGADPVEPVLSNGFLYTLDRNQSGDPTLWTVDVANGRMAALDGQRTYPRLSPLEHDNFASAQVILDGPRVVYNNPQSHEAVVVFTDGEHPPVVIDKSQAETVSAAGPADLNAPNPKTMPGAKTNPANGKTPVPAVAAVSQQTTCANTTQKPYAPQITGISPSSGSALIQWAYQLLDQTDCEPSSWTVQVTALSGSHQPAQSLRLVNGQDQFLFTGLRPVTTYQVVVTAYINRQFTASTPATFTTTTRGPDAPTSVQTHSDGNGNWVVSWTPCTEQANPNCVVPAAQWSVVGTACRGSFVGTPPTVQVAGGQDTVTVSAASLELLGDSLSFSVQGSLVSGLTGNPTGDGSCTEAYQKPDVTAISLTGQGVEDPETNTINATLDIQSSGDPQSVYGVPPAKAEFIYTVSYPVGGSTETQTLSPVNKTTAHFGGLPAGVPLTPSVQIIPDGHQDASATVTGAPFQQTLAWPSDLAGGGTMATGTVSPDWNSGAFTVTLPPDTPAGPLTAVAPTAANAPGTGPQLQCGGAGGATSAFPNQLVTADRQLSFPLSDLVDTGGTCTISFSLIDGARPNPYGGPSPSITAAFSIGSEPSYSFRATFVNCRRFQCGAFGTPYTVEVDSAEQAFRFAGGGDWTVTATDPAGRCSATQADSTPPNFPFDLTLPSACADPSHITVAVSWKYLGQSEQQSRPTGDHHDHHLPHHLGPLRPEFQPVHHRLHDDHHRPRGGFRAPGLRGDRVGCQSYGRRRRSRGRGGSARGRRHSRRRCPDLGHFRGAGRSST